MLQFSNLSFPTTVRDLAQTLEGRYSLSRPEAISAIYRLMELETLIEDFMALDFLESRIQLAVQPQEFWEIADAVAEEISSVTQLDRPKSDLSVVTPEGSVQIVATLPENLSIGQFDQVTSMRNSFTELISGARHSLKIASPYVDAPGLGYLSSAFQLVAQARTKVQFLTRIDDRTAPQPRHLQALLTLFGTLGDLLQVRSYSRQIKSRTGATLNWGGLHAKIIVVDEERLYLGSGEPRDNALSRNFEVGIISSSSALAATVTHIFDAVWAVSDEITLEYCLGFVR